MSTAPSIVAGTAITTLAIVGSAAAQSSNCLYDLSNIAPRVEQFLNQNPQIPGINVRIQRGSIVLYERAFGSYTIDTVVPIASATKWISGAVIMSLVDDGVFALDDPLALYLPSFRTPELSSITVRQGFSMTAGFAATDECNACLSDRSTTVQQCAALIAQDGVISTPGTEFCYGGCSMQAVGAAAEVASGQSWNALFRERIQIPIGMADTTYGVGQNPRISGGISSTLRDYAAFLEMQLLRGVSRGTQVLSPLAVEVMQANQVGGLPLVCVPNVPAEEGFAGYAIGNWVNAVNDSGASVQNSSEGAFGFSPWIDRTRSVAGVFLVVDQNQRTYDLAQFIQFQARLAVDTSPDVNGDGAVGFQDITRVLVNWGRLSQPGLLLGPGPIGDANADGRVEFGDITRILTRWGEDCGL